MKRLLPQRWHPHSQTTVANKTVLQANDKIWREISAIKRTPKIQEITAKSGKIVLQPHDKKTCDIKGAATTLTEDVPINPRITFHNIESQILVHKN